MFINEFKSFFGGGGSPFRELEGEAKGIAKFLSSPLFSLKGIPNNGRIVKYWRSFAKGFRPFATEKREHEMCGNEIEMLMKLEAVKFLPLPSEGFYTLRDKENGRYWF